MIISNKKKIRGVVFILFLMCHGVFAFDEGFTLGLRSNFSGSYTNPIISKADKDYLGAAFMKGMVGFVMSGEAELTYIFGSQKYFKYESNEIFGGLGLAFNLGIGQGFSGQISGQYNEKVGQINVYCRVFMSPVLNFGTSLKTYLLKNRLSLGFTIGGKVPLDPDPTYELYSNLSKEKLDELKAENPPIDFSPETGTLVITEKAMKKINPIGCILKGSIEYNQPVIKNMELNIGAYMQYFIYKPKYVIMPKKIQDAAILNGKTKKPPVDVNFERDQIKSFYMNSLDFGVSLGLLFKV